VVVTVRSDDRHDGHAVKEQTWLPGMRHGS
jgi:hypothetical protein